MDSLVQDTPLLVLKLNILEVVLQSSQSNAIDLSLKPIDLLTVGYGTILSRDANSGTIDLSSRSTSFFNLYFGLGPVDFLAGYRKWDT